MTLSAINPVVGVSTPFGMIIPGSSSILPRGRIADSFLDHLIKRVALHATDIVLILQQRTQRIPHHLRRQGTRIKLGECGRPVDGLRHAWDLEQILLTKRLHEADYLLRQLGADVRHAGFDDGQLALGRRIIDPVIKAATLQRVVDFRGSGSRVTITIGGCGALTVPNSGIDT